jgi:hypothetical protein
MYFHTPIGMFLFGLISATEDLISDLREDVTLNTNGVRKCCLPFEKENKKITFLL